MTQEQKIIRAKVGLLELANQLGNVSQACEMMSIDAPSSCAKAAFWSLLVLPSGNLYARSSGRRDSRTRVLALRSAARSMPGLVK
jgi:hypothetical protein